MGQIDNNKKYHISDEGIIYRVNEDGSFTQLGDIVEFINNANENNSVSPEKATSRKRIKPYVIIIICALTLGLYKFFFIREMPVPDSAVSAPTVSPQTAVIDTVVEYQESPELQKKNSELKAKNARLHQQIDRLIEKNNNLRQRNEVIAKENDKLNQQVKNLLKQITL